MVKKTLVGFLLFSALAFATAPSAHALSAQELQTQLEALMARITELTAQMNALRGQNTSTAPSVKSALAHRLCAMQLRSFSEGAQGDDVRAFQEFLQSEGYFYETPTGFFGPITREALASWQEAQGFERAGVVGPKTLERIRSRCSVGNRSSLPGKLVPVPAPPAVCTEEYAPICGAKPVVCITAPCNPVPTTYSNRCMMNADKASFLYEGACGGAALNPADDPQCKAWYDGCNSCSREAAGEAVACTLKYCPFPGKAYCTDYFNATSNRPPTISGLSGPTTLAVGQVGTWTIVASDPENGTLSYSIDWGETKLYQGYGAATPTEQFKQTTLVSHAYAAAGTYTISIIVTDSAGRTAAAATTVKVGNAETTCVALYQPVCGRPPGCANTCVPGQVCPAICQLQEPRTYSNSCYLSAAGAQFLHEGQCTTASGNIY